MSASIGISAFGTLLKRGDGGGPETFTAIAEVTNIGGPDRKLDTVDMTHHESPGGWEELIGTILRSGEVKADLNYLPGTAGHQALLTDQTNRTKRNFKLVFPDQGNTTWAFAALVTGLSPKAPHDGKLEASVTLKVTGAIS